METIKDILARLGKSTPTNITEPNSKLSETANVPEFCPPPEHCICGGTGFFRVQVDLGHRWYGKAHPCICAIQRTRLTNHAWLWQESRIPDRYRDKTLLDFNTKHEGNKAMLKEARAFITGQLETPWLAILGTYGCGKTHICTAIIRSFVLRDIYAVYAFVPDILKEMRRGIENKNYFEVLDTWKRAQILALDDLGVEQDTDWVRAEMEELVDYRYREGKATVIATNKALSSLTPRIARRMNDGGMCTLVVNNAPDYGSAA